MLWLPFAKTLIIAPGERFYEPPPDVTQDDDSDLSDIEQLKTFQESWALKNKKHAPVDISTASSVTLVPSTRRISVVDICEAVDEEQDVHEKLQEIIQEVVNSLPSTPSSGTSEALLESIAITQTVGFLVTGVTIIFELLEGFMRQ